MRSFAFARLAATSGLGLLLIGCPEASTPSGDVASSGTAEPVAASGAQGLMYKMGLMLAEGVRPLDFKEDEVKFILAGADDTLSRRELAAKLEDYRPQIEKLVQERQLAAQQKEEAASKEFVAAAAKESGAQAFPSGLVYRETKAGSGPKPGPTSEVTVHYTGTLRDGRIFDSSSQRGQPATFPLNQVIPCWTEALQKMSAGGSATIHCPSEIAYGPSGQGQLIPGGAALKFDVELLEVKATVTPPSAAEDPQETPKPQETPTPDAAQEPKK